MVTLKKGDIITIKSKESYTSKPRPAIVYQNELFNSVVESITIIPLSGTIIDAELFRISIIPNSENNLKKLSQALVDKITTIPAKNVGDIVGYIDIFQLQKIDDAVKIWLDID